MKSSVFRLIQRAIFSFNLFEFILPMINIIIGLGIVSSASFMIDFGFQIQMILFLAFLEVGSQLFGFYKREFLRPFSKIEALDERNAVMLLVILFFGLSFLPLSRILQDSRSSLSYLTFLALSSFLIIIWRNIGESPISQILSIFIFSLNNSFLIPLTELMLFGLKTNVLFTTISQILFLSLFGFFVIREIYRIEIIGQQSKIVQTMGSIPLLRMAIVILFLGSVLLTIYSINNPKIENITFASISLGLLLLLLHQTFILDRNGKSGLNTIYRVTAVLLITQFIGWVFLLWVL